MAEKKRKASDHKKRKTVISTKKRTKSSNKSETRNERRKGPRLPNALRKELDRINYNNQQYDDKEDEDILSDEEFNNVYEYEEGLPEEESKKNHRYDPVENCEYELPKHFEDENVQSDDDDDDGDDYSNDNDNYVKKADDRKRKKLDRLIDDVNEGDDGIHHLRMLQGITGLPTEAFDGKRRNKENLFISEAYPESEFNPSRDVLDGDGRVSIEDLLGSIHGTSEYSQLRKRASQMEKNSTPLHAPVPKQIQVKLERQEAYQLAKKDVTKWEPLVKRNREAPTIIFDKDIDLGFSTVGAIASEFEPRTEFEKKMASLVYDDKVMEAHKEDGARLLELNKVSAEDVRDKWNHIAKMRSLLFCHEVKMKRVKKIKSKVYRRLLKKDRMKASYDGMHLDPEEAKELAMKHAKERAKERMTLRHKNHSKWARRVLQRGLNIQDDSTREAMSEQLHQHALLTRKVRSMKDSSSDDSSEDENSDGSDHNERLRILTKGKEKTLKVLQEDDEVPNSGMLSLPFMVRGLKKRKEEAVEEAKFALQEYESSIKELEHTGGAESRKTCSVSGRRVFSASKTQASEPKHKIRSDDIDDNSDSECELADKDDDDDDNNVQKDVNTSSDMLTEDSDGRRDSKFKNLDNMVGDADPKTAYEVAIFASGCWKKLNGENKVGTNMERSPMVAEPVIQSKDRKELSEESDVDDEGQMVDGILSSDPKSSYRLPSQEELIREAFAGDDVEEEFTKYKEELLNEENPEPEKPVLLPGWGQWTDMQRKKGVPSWMQKEHETAMRKREETLKKRKDARLRHVVISEKLDKKAEKLHTKTLPYPFTSKEVFEQSLRVPIGPESNPATAVGALNRPEVVKKPGLIIKPIKYEDVDPYKREENKTSGRKQKPRKTSRPATKAVVAKS